MSKYNHLITDEFDEWDKYEYLRTYRLINGEIDITEETEEDIKVTKKCTCKWEDLIRYGCKCGAFQEEQKEKKEKENVK